MNTVADELLNDLEAAKYIGSARASLKQSRHTGFLFGRPAPPFLKMGRSVRYKLSVLLEFRDQFPEYRNTSEIVPEPSRNNPSSTGRDDGAEGEP